MIGTRSVALSPVCSILNLIASIPVGLALAGRASDSTLANDHAAPRLRGPARRAAGFDEEEFLAVRPRVSKEKGP
jgi:hypothetical protein